MGAVLLRKTQATVIAGQILPIGVESGSRPVAYRQREVGGGRVPCQSGQVRKEAATTSFDLGRLSASYFKQARTDRCQISDKAQKPQAGPRHIADTRHPAHAEYSAKYCHPRKQAIDDRWAAGWAAINWPKG